MEKREIKIGHEVKDIVTGITGTVMAHTQWLTGCDTVVVEPKVGSDGKKPDNLSFDLNRVEYHSEGVRPKFFPEEYKAVPEPTPEKPGGPHDLMVHPNHIKLR